MRLGRRVEPRAKISAASYFDRCEWWFSAIPKILKYHLQFRRDGLCYEQVVQKNSYGSPWARRIGEDGLSTSAYRPGSQTKLIRQNIANEVIYSLTNLERIVSEPKRV